MRYSLILLGGVQGRLKRALATTKGRYRVRRCSPKDFVSLRSSRRAYLSCLGLQQANAIEAAATPDPNVIYADQSAQRPAANRLCRALQHGRWLHRIPFRRRTKSRRLGYQQQPAYQQQPSYQPQPPLLPQQEEASDPRQRPFDLEIREAVGRLSRQGRPPAPSSSIRPTSSCSWCRATARPQGYGIGVGKPGFHLVGHQDDLRQKGMAGLDAAGGNAGAATGSCRGTWEGGPATRSARARPVSGILALPHPRLQRALDHWHQRLVRMHPDAQRGRDRSLRPRQCRRQGRRHLIGL